MRRLILRTLALVAVVAALVLMGLGGVTAESTSTSSATYYYQPQITFLQASPNLLTPQAVPP